MAAAPTRAARRRAVAAELRLLARDLPVIPLVFPPGSFAYRPAAYAGWAFVEGSGIFEKRSFVSERAPGRGTQAGGGGGAAANAPIGDPVDRAADGGGSTLPWVLGGGGLLLAIVAGGILAGSRRARR